MPPYVRAKGRLENGTHTNGLIDRPAAAAPNEAERGEGEDGCLEGEGLLPADAVDEEEGEHRARELCERRPHQLHVVVRLQTAEIQVALSIPLFSH